jgi:hypothetical protein
MIERLHRLDVTRLAADFSAAVRAAHSEAELQAIRDRNAAENDSQVDHVHDYCDANDLMAEAINAQWSGLQDFTGNDWSWSDFADEIDDAWQRAKASGFALSRILVACEWSGTVRDAFAARGHDATSCDILETASPGKHHVGDVREIMDDGYDMMISFPPCTYLSSCQLWRCKPEHDKNYPERQNKSDEALEFVRDLMAAKVNRWALENPRGRIGSTIRKADQEIHPYQFGHDVSKTTGLWLDGVDPLVPDPDDYIEPRVIEYKGKMVERWGNQSPCGADKMGPSADRGHKRGKTYAGIANAMADTWGGILRKLTPKAEVIQLEMFA